MAPLVAATRRLRPDLVLVNTPHNPTGLRLGVDALAVLADACIAVGALLVVDEVARATLDPGARSVVGSAGFAAGGVAVVGDVSKALGLGGLRCGWVTSAARGLVGRAAALKTRTTLGNAGPAQLLAALALEASGEIGRRTTEVARVNRRALRHLVGELDGRWTEPEDGLVAFPGLMDGPAAATLATDLRRRHGVAVVPGTLFGVSDRVRVGLGLDPELFADALDRIAAALLAQAA